MVNGKHLAVLLHVDDLKVSYEDVEVVNEFLEISGGEFEKEILINKSHGKIHNYLGMV